MNLTRYDPFTEIDSFFDRYMRAFNRPVPRRIGEIADFDWSPVADVSENPDEYHIQVELPGINKEDVHISIDNDVLTVQGERKEKKETRDIKHHRTERFYGSFTRSFSLPRNIDQTKVVADYNDGVLSLHLPKTEEETPKSFEVKVH